MTTDLVDTKSKSLVDQARTFAESGIITKARSPHEYSLVSQRVKDLKASWKQIEELRVHLKEPALESCRRVDNLFQPALKAISAAETQAKRVQIDYENEQERIAREAQARADATAQAERDRLDAIARAEVAAAEAESRRLREEARKAQEAGDEVQRNILVGQAITAVKAAEEKAEAIQEQSEAVVAPTVLADIPVIQGQSTKEVWKHRLTDVSLLPREFMVPNDAMLAAVAKTAKKPSHIPGVEFYPEKVKSSR